MSDIRNYEDVLRRLTQAKKDYERKLQLWEAVGFTAKKDGSEFANFNKNLINCKRIVESYEDEFHPVLHVCGRIDGEWAEENIYAYIYCDTMKKDDPRREQGLKAYSYNRETYLLTIEECKALIEEHKLFLADKIKDYEKQISLSEKAWSKYYLAVANATQELLKNCEVEGTFKNTLFYSVRDGVNYQTFGLQEVKAMTERIENEIKIINDYCLDEFEHEADTSNLKEIGVLYTTFDTEQEDEIDLQVDIDVINQTITAYNPYTDEIYRKVIYTTTQELGEWLSWSTLYGLHP